jgi:hypothetical protein
LLAPEPSPVIVNINTDINILGGIPTFDLVSGYIAAREKGGDSAAVGIRTEKSVKRFGKAIKSTFFSDKNESIKLLLEALIRKEGISNDSLILLFVTASSNNELLDYLNRNVYFPALYSGRSVLKKDEVVACLGELKGFEPAISEWSDYTLDLTASKYLTLLKKFNLVSGAKAKTIFHPYLSDKAFVLVLYWLASVVEKPNVLGSRWLPYAFSEKGPLVDRVRQNRYSNYISINFSGDQLSVKPLLNYGEIYDALTEPKSDY